MNKIALTIISFLLLHGTIFGQSQSIDEFRTDFKEDKGIFFYPSTVQVLSFKDEPEIQSMIDGIEKVRILIYNLAEKNVSDVEIKKLKKQLKNEDYEDLMVMKSDGKDFNLIGKVNKNTVTGFVAFIKEGENLILIDLKGEVNLKKIVELSKHIEKKALFLDIFN